MAKNQTDTAADVADTAQTDTAAKPEQTLGHYLVVRHAFGAYRKGDAIRDEATILDVLAGDDARNVHKVLE